MTTDRLTELLFKPGALTPREIVEFDGLMTIESRKPCPRYRSRDNGHTVDVFAPLATAKTAATAELSYSQAVARCNELSRRRNLSDGESREFIALCARTKRGY